MDRIEIFIILLSINNEDSCHKEMSQVVNESYLKRQSKERILEMSLILQEAGVECDRVSSTVIIIKSKDQTVSMYEYNGQWHTRFHYKGHRYGLSHHKDKSLFCVLNGNYCGMSHKKAFILINFLKEWQTT